MQAYNQGFARVYNSRWSGFARQVAPFLLDFYATTAQGQSNKSVLDLGCGTGQLAVHFLEKGYRVMGLDLSEPMLHWARENARAYLDSGQARFVQEDASHFTLGEHFGLVVSTFDTLNHLENESALRRCFECVFAASDGYFIFDLNTRRGLRGWNSIQVDDSNPDALIIRRGIYDGQSERAWVRITGFMSGPTGLYERFDETAFNTVFELERVITALREIGWSEAYCARVQDLKSPLVEPEHEDNVFVVAHK
jgi:SAM-dependent methyltransferase